MAEGWLWLSMRMATAMPSPASMTPAFSPGPTRTWGASVGSRLRWTRDDLYEQCSLHITANRASSRWLGARRRMASTSSRSPSVRPRARWSGTPSTIGSPPARPAPVAAPSAERTGGPRSLAHAAGRHRCPQTAMDRLRDGSLAPDTATADRGDRGRRHADPGVPTDRPLSGVPERAPSPISAGRPAAARRGRTRTRCAGQVPSRQAIARRQWTTPRPSAAAQIGHRRRPGSHPIATGVRARPSRPSSATPGFVPVIRHVAAIRGSIETVGHATELLDIADSGRLSAWHATAFDEITQEDPDVRRPQGGFGQRTGRGPDRPPATSRRSSRPSPDGAASAPRTRSASGWPPSSRHCPAADPLSRLHLVEEKQRLEAELSHSRRHRRHGGTREELRQGGPASTASARASRTRPGGRSG